MLSVTQRLKKVWREMHRRCTSETSRDFHRYGARGIAVVEEWADFYKFLAWALEHGYQVGLEIDRRDNKGPYAPWNCRFVTKKVNGRNKRNNLIITAFGETKTLAEWAEDSRCVVPYKILNNRISRNKIDPESAITTLEIGVRRYPRDDLVTKKSRLIEFAGLRLPMAAMARRFGLTGDQLYERLSCGWDTERALTTPMRKDSRRPAVLLTLK